MKLVKFFAYTEYGIAGNFREVLIFAIFVVDTVGLG